MSTQIELIPKNEWEHLYPHWRESLQHAIRDAFYFRHARNTTGWSYAIGGISFAESLFRHGQLTREEFRRYFVFFRRTWKMELKDRRTK